MSCLSVYSVCVTLDILFINTYGLFSVKSNFYLQLKKYYNIEYKLILRNKANKFQS